MTRDCDCGCGGRCRHGRGLLDARPLANATVTARGARGGIADATKRMPGGGVLIVSVSDRVLFLLRDAKAEDNPDLWELQGGKAEGGETAADAVLHRGDGILGSSARRWLGRHLPERVEDAAQNLKPRRGRQPICQIDVHDRLTVDE